MIRSKRSLTVTHCLPASRAPFQCWDLTILPCDAMLGRQSCGRTEDTARVQCRPGRNLSRGSIVASSGAAIVRLFIRYRSVGRPGQFAVTAVTASRTSSAQHCQAAFIQHPGQGKPLKTFRTISSSCDSEKLLINKTSFSPACRSSLPTALSRGV